MILANQVEIAKLNIFVYLIYYFLQCHYLQVYFEIFNLFKLIDKFDNHYEI